MKIGPFGRIAKHKEFIILVKWEYDGITPTCE